MGVGQQGARNLLVCSRHLNAAKSAPQARSFPATTIPLPRHALIVRRGSQCEVTGGVVDKYEPGDCGWSLDVVTYRVINSLDDKLRASESGWYGTTIAFFVQSDAGAQQNVGNKEEKTRFAF